MNPFLPGDGQVPYPPVDIPAPDIPAPDFKTIGETFEKAKRQVEKDDPGDPWWLAWIPKILQLIVGTLLSFLLKVVTWLLRLVFQVFNTTDSSMNELAATAISGMTGIETNAGSFSSLTNRDSRKEVAAAIATIFSNALRGSVTLDSQGGIVPTDASANKFMEIGAHMAIEGWMQGWIVELLTWEKAERFADLKDTLEQTLGVGRLARRAMAAPMKVLVEEPYTWLLNQKYHPTLLSPGELVREYIRGGMDRDTLQNHMSFHGYTADKVDVLINLGKTHLSAADLQILVDSKSITHEDAIARLKAQGYDDADAAALLFVAHYGKVQANARAWVSELSKMALSQQITLAEFEDQMNKSGLPDWEAAETIRRVEYKLQVERKYFTLAEGELLVKKGLWDLNQFRSLAQHYGYSASDERDLELLLLVEIKDAADAAQKKAAADQARGLAKQARDAAAAAKVLRIKTEIESKGVSQAQYETLVEEGLRTFQQYHAYLTSKGIAIDNADALVTVLGNKLAAKKAAADLKTAAAGQAKVRQLDVAQLEAAVKQGLLTVDDFIARMLQIGMSATDAALLGAELRGQIDSAAAKEKAVTDAKAAAAVKHVDVSQEERAVRLGVQTIEQYAAFLDSHGFEPHDRDILVSALQAQLAADKQTAATKSGATAVLAGKGISLPQLERLVRAGVKTTADYQAALTAAGYGAADQAALMQFLQLQMDQDQQDLIVHGHAASLVGQLGVSLTDLERAVKFSVVPIATYQDALKRAGVSSADQQTLVKNLAAEIKATRAQQAASATVSKQVAAAGVSLATLEKDVLRGALSMEQFQGLLAGYGVPATQVTDEVQLVQDQMDNQLALATLVNQAAARAAAKGLDLAQDTAAFKQGVMSEEEWRARVAALGYDDADVEVLFETLAAQQAATAAKSSKKTSANGATPAPGAAAAVAGG